MKSVYTNVKLEWVNIIALKSLNLHHYFTKEQYFPFFVTMPTSCWCSSVSWSDRSGWTDPVKKKHITKSQCVKRNPNSDSRALTVSTGWQAVHLRQAYIFSDRASDQFEGLHLKTSCVCLHPGWGGFTPLHYAALHGNRALVDLFLSNGADPNLACDSGQTAFHFGCRWAVVWCLCL